MYISVKARQELGVTAVVRGSLWRSVCLADSITHHQGMSSL